MNTQVIWAIVAIAAILLAIFGIWYYVRQTNTKRLRERFGPEYDSTVRRFNSQERAEAELKQREKRVRNYNIVSLPRAERVQYQETWMAVQGKFVDQPEAAVAEANRLVRELMHKCGYPMADFEQSAADLSVDHPAVVENYRAAHRIAERSQRGAASTEELRQALVYYRALFDDLLETDEAGRVVHDRRQSRSASTEHVTRH